MGKAKESFMELRESDTEQKGIKPKITGLTINSQSFLTASKDDIATKAMAVTDEYLSGHKSPTEGLIIVKKMLDFAEQVKNNLSDAASTELKLASKESRDVAGNKINEQMVGVKYDYSQCGDLLYDRAMAIVKEREAFLKTVVAEQITGDLSTGETWSVKPPVKSGKLGLIIKY